MCGIAGAVSFGDFRVTPDYVTALREPLAHRGPDGARTWVDDEGRVGLGFRRLAIIDLSDEAMQPMTNEDGSVRLLMNGEIYNHAELRQELEAAGLLPGTPVTVSDTGDGRVQVEVGGQVVDLDHAVAAEVYVSV